MDYKLGYLSLDIICRSKLTVLLKLCSGKTVHFSEQIMSAEKYHSIFLHHMEAYFYFFMFGCFIAGHWSQSGRSTYLLESRVHKTYGRGQGILQ